MSDRTVDLKGLVPAVVLPLDEKYQIDEAELRRYIMWLVSHEGLAGVAVNADTGEGPHLSPAERIRVLEVWVEEVAGRIPVVAGIGGPSTAAEVDGATAAKATGADAVLVFPIPAYLGTPRDPELPYRYHASVQEAAGLPMVLFQLQPALGGVLFSEDVLLKLFSLEMAVAIKEASFDAVEFIRMANLIRKHAPHITLLTGNDNFIYESFILGAEGALIGFGTLAVAEQIAMIRAAQARDWDTGHELNTRVVAPLSEAVFAAPVRDYRVRTKHALQMMGVLERTHVRPPLLPLSPPELETLREAMLATDQIGGAAGRS
ncbi:dihydrodipicolinate synthase family protein [soil metagenome]